MMRMNLKYLTMCAATAAVAFTGCSMEGDDADKIIAGGDKALFTITVSGPETYAVDANATASEVAVKSIDVFIYDNGMNLAKHARKEGAAIVPVAGSANTWTLAADEEIETTVGSKNIYVGINLTAAMGTSIAADGVSVEKSITALTDLCAANNFVMFSTEPANKTLEAIGDGTTPVINVVTTSVSRLVSKILFYGETEYTAGGEGALTDLQFTASNVNNKFFPLPDLANYYDPNFTSVNMLNSFFGYDEPTNKVFPFVAVNHASTAANLLTAVYATENTAIKGAVAGAFTYGIVKGVYTPKVMSYWTGSALTTLPPSANKDFFAVRLTNDGTQQTLFFKDKENAKLYVSSELQGAIAEDHVEEYKGGVCYYGVIFNGAEKAGASEHSIYRNTLYRVTVDAVKGLGSSTWKIEEPYNPFFPPIIIPTVPPGEDDDETALLTIKVGIEPWVLEAPQGTVLGND